MKTLKQILSRHYTVFEYDNLKDAVVEWLEQFEKEIREVPSLPYYAIGQDDLLQVLLGELKDD